MRVFRWVCATALGLFLVLGALSTSVRASEYHYEITMDTSSVMGTTGGIDLILQYANGTLGPPLSYDNTFTVTTTALSGATPVPPPVGIIYSANETGDLTNLPVTMALNTSTPPAGGTAPELTQYLTYGNSLDLFVTVDTSISYPTPPNPLTGVSWQLTLYDQNGNPFDLNSLGNSAQINVYSDGLPPVTLAGSGVTITPLFQQTPEPSSGVLLGLTTVFLGGYACWRRYRRAAQPA